MSYTQTSNLSLYKDNGDERIKNLRIHNNANIDVLDTQIQALKDVIVNAKALLGQLGVDANGDPLVDINTARGVLNAAADGTSGEETLYSVNQQAAQNAVDIAALQDSVCIDLSFGHFSGNIIRYGKLRILHLYNGAAKQTPQSGWQLDAVDFPSVGVNVGNWVLISEGNYGSRYLNIDTSGVITTSGDVLRGGWTAVYFVN